MGYEGRSSLGGLREVRKVVEGEEMSENEAEKKRSPRLNYVRMFFSMI